MLLRFLVGDHLQEELLRLALAYVTMKEQELPVIVRYLKDTHKNRQVSINGFVEFVRIMKRTQKELSDEEAKQIDRALSAYLKHDLIDDRFKAFLRPEWADFWKLYGESCKAAGVEEDWFENRVHLTYMHFHTEILMMENRCKNPPQPRQ